MQRAIREAVTSPLQQYLRGLPLASKVFLAALLAQTRRTGVGECLLAAVVEEAKRMASLHESVAVKEFLLESAVGGVGASPQKGKTAAGKSSRVLAMGVAATDLAEAGILLLESRRGERTGKVRLNVGDEEVRLAYKDDAAVRGMGFA